MNHKQGPKKESSGILAKVEKLIGFRRQSKEEKKSADMNNNQKPRTDSSDIQNHGNYTPKEFKQKVPKSVKSSNKKFGDVILLMTSDSWFNLFYNSKYLMREPKVFVLRCKTTDYVLCGKTDDKHKNK